MSREIEEFGFRLSLGIQEVDAYLTEDEIADVKRLAEAFKERRTERIRVRAYWSKWLSELPPDSPIFDPNHPMKSDFDALLRYRGMDRSDVELELQRRKESEKDHGS